MPSEGNWPLAEFPRRAARAFGQRVAIVSRTGSLTFDELARRTEVFADRLRRLGLRAGDRVALIGENALEWVIAYYGICAAGAVAVLVNPRRSLGDLDAILAENGVRTLVASRSLLKALTAPVDLPVIAWGPGPRFAPHEDFESVVSDQASPSFDDQRMRPPGEVICYTSGTTGPSKAVRLSHRSVATSAAMLALMHGRSSNDVIVSAMSCANVYGASILNSSMMVGARLVLLDTFEADHVLACFDEHRATMLDGVPTMYLELLHALRQRGEALRGMRMCAVGGAPIPPVLLAELEMRIGCPVVELWGMTEIAGIGTTHPFRNYGTRGTVGVPMPRLEVRIAPLLHPRGVATPGAVGELEVRGPVVMEGYLHSAQSNRRDGSDGWFRTGDLVRRIDTGELVFVDRLADAIELSDGYVFPAEIERVVGELPQVAMVGVPIEDGDQPWGGEVFVVKVRGASIDESEILAHCRGRLPTNHQPRTICFREQLPLTGTGKVWRRRLKCVDAV